MEALSGFVRRAEKAESEIDYLLKELNALESGGAKVTATKAQSPAPASSEQLDKLKSENTKLKYRLGILQVWSLRKNIKISSAFCNRFSGFKLNRITETLRLSNSKS